MYPRYILTVVYPEKRYRPPKCSRIGKAAALSNLNITGLKLIPWYTSGFT